MALAADVIAHLQRAMDQVAEAEDAPVGVHERRLRHRRVSACRDTAAWLVSQWGVRLLRRRRGGARLEMDRRARERWGES